MRERTVFILAVIVVILAGFVYGQRAAGEGTVSIGGPAGKLQVPYGDDTRDGRNVDRYQSAVQVYLSACGAGGGASGTGWSGTIVAGESRVCEILRVAAALDGIGATDEARELVFIARRLVDPQHTLAQRASLYVREWVLDPLFNFIPWVGSSAY